MHYSNLKIHNVAVLLEGDGRAVVPPSSPGSASDSITEYAAADAEGRWCSRLPESIQHNGQAVPEGALSAGFAAAQAYRNKENVPDIDTVQLCNTFAKSGVKTRCEFFF